MEKLPWRKLCLGLKGVVENGKLPSMEEMFRVGDKIKQAKKYTTKEAIELSHELRKGR